MRTSSLLKHRQELVSASHTHTHTHTHARTRAHTHTHKHTVSEATGQVVASTQSGLVLHKQDSEVKMDYSKLSLTQAKRLEMESQVKALELEKELETERTRLAELRKIHYKLAGASEGWDEVSVCMCVCVCLCVYRGISPSQEQIEN